jgi:hypothetical protein
LLDVNAEGGTEPAGTGLAAAPGLPPCPSLDAALEPGLEFVPAGPEAAAGPVGPSLDGVPLGLDGNADGARGPDGTDESPGELTGHAAFAAFPPLGRLLQTGIAGAEGLAPGLPAAVPPHQVGAAAGVVHAGAVGCGMLPPCQFQEPAGREDFMPPPAAPGSDPGLDAAKSIATA